MTRFRLPARPLAAAFSLVILAGCGPTQTAPVRPSALEPAPVTPVQAAPLESLPPASARSGSSADQRRFERKQRGCQADPVPDECIN